MSELPSHASVIVIGGGIMGCSTLYHLAEMGATDAILLERNKPVSGTTWHSATGARASSFPKPNTHDQYSVDLYARLEQETGQSVGWIQKGSLSLATNPDRLTHIKRKRPWPTPMELMRNPFLWLRQRNAGLMNAEDVLGAVWSPDGGSIHQMSAQP